MLMHRDSNPTGSVDHAQCCRLRATAQSLYGRGAFEPVKERPVGERQWAWTLGKTRKTPLLSIKAQQRVDTTRSRRDNKFSSHASGDMKPGWTSSFSPSSWRGRRHACRSPTSFNGGRERRFLVEQKMDVCFLLRSSRLVHVIFVYSGVLRSAFEWNYNG